MQPDLPVFQGGGDTQEASRPNADKDEIRLCAVTGQQQGRKHGQSHRGAEQQRVTPQDPLPFIEPGSEAGFRPQFANGAMHGISQQG